MLVRIYGEREWVSLEIDIKAAQVALASFTGPGSEPGLLMAGAFVGAALSGMLPGNQGSPGRLADWRDRYDPDMDMTVGELVFNNASRMLINLRPILDADRLGHERAVLLIGRTDEVGDSWKAVVIASGDKTFEELLSQGFKSDHVQRDLEGLHASSPFRQFAALACEPVGRA